MSTEVEERVRRALSACAGQITPDRLQPAVPPTATPARRARLPWWRSLLLVTAVLVAVVFAVRHPDHATPLPLPKAPAATVPSPSPSPSLSLSLSPSLSPLPSPSLSPASAPRPTADPAPTRPGVSRRLDSATPGVTTDRSPAGPVAKSTDTPVPPSTPRPPARSP